MFGRLVPANQRQNLRDRALLGLSAVAGLAGVTAIATLGRWMGTTAMTFMIGGLFLLTACGLAALVLRMRNLGLRPPSLAEIRQREDVSPSDRS